MDEARGKKLTVRFDGQRCIHSRFCVTGAPLAFRANVQGPWIDADADQVDRLVEVAHACPSGAITYERHDGGEAETAPPVNLARVMENGPIALRGKLLLQGQPIGFRAVMCRCGQSKTKPYCDGSHTAAAFAATGEPASGKTEMLTARDGPLELFPQPDGPLGVKGNLEIIAGSGRVVERTERCFLCRCGQSKTKPFCDGTHKTVGFKA